MKLLLMMFVGIIASFFSCCSTECIVSPNNVTKNSLDYKQIGMMHNEGLEYVFINYHSLIKRAHALMRDILLAINKRYLCK